MTGGSAADLGDSADRGGSVETDVSGGSDPTPAAAFQQLGNETRVDIVRQLYAEGPCTFSSLFEASQSDSSAGFAYHLRQLDQFVRQREDERWELTAAGREAARAVQSGNFTERADHGDVPVDEACPLCDEYDLSLTVSDSVASVSCGACDASIMRLSCPPSGFREDEDLPGTLDTYHRHRLRTFAEGVCPDCGGRVETTATTVTPEGGDDDVPAVAQLECTCTRCTASFDYPVTLAVLDHPAVVSFYDDHGQTLADRPVWNVGSEWRERVLSTDPWCLLVSTQLDDEQLELYVDGEGTVREHRRHCKDRASSSAEATDATTESDEFGDDAAA